MFIKASNIHFKRKGRYKMVASRQIEIPFYRRIGRKCGRGFGALAQIIGTTAIVFLRKHIVSAAKRVGAALLDFVVSEIADVVSGRKNFKTAAMSGGRRTLRKQLCSKKRKSSRVISTTSAMQSSCSRGYIFTNISHSSCRVIFGTSLLWQFLENITALTWDKDPIIDNVLTYHEYGTYSSTSFNVNCKEFDFQTDRSYYVDLRQSY